ncbi:MAG: hypothetical protein KAR19_15025 [Bacteroidales bacterium]|nr:hypothetical protein [Bacteroidales bacterium]
MRTKGLILLLLIASHYTKAQNPDISGFARTYEGILFDNGNFGIMQQTLNLNFEQMGDKVAFKANPMVYLYNADSLDFRMRELYLDLYFDNFDIRIGKQQVVWGKADGVFITDVVSPLNLSEFLLPDFDEIRKGVVATKLNYYVGNSTLEAIWIPVFTPTEKPPPGSIWYIQPDFPAPPAWDFSLETITPGLETSEIFLKYTALTSAIDFELMGAYTWDDNPTLHVQKEFSVDPNTMQPILEGLNITPEHHRLAIGGGSLSSEIKGVILRGEAAYYNGKYFLTEDPLQPDGNIQKDYLHYLVGLDFNLGPVKLSSQFIQQTILNYDSNILNEKTENTMTFLARYDMLRETLHLELFSYIGLTNEDALIRPKITYDFDDSFSILFGSNIFAGDEKGRFGQYGDNSMAYLKIKYSF